MPELRHPTGAPAAAWWLCVLGAAFCAFMITNRARRSDGFFKELKDGRPTCVQYMLAHGRWADQAFRMHTVAYLPNGTRTTRITSSFV